MLRKLVTAEGLMQKLLQPRMMRGRVADRAAQALLFGLLGVLFTSFIHGILTLGN